MRGWWKHRQTTSTDSARANRGRLPSRSSEDSTNRGRWPTSGSACSSCPLRTEEMESTRRTRNSLKESGWASTRGQEKRSLARTMGSSWPEPCAGRWNRKPSTGGRSSPFRSRHGTREPPERPCQTQYRQCLKSIKWIRLASMLVGPTYTRQTSKKRDTQMDAQDAEP